MIRSIIVVSSFSVLAICSLLGLDAHGVRFDELEYGVPKEGLLSQKGDLYDYMEALQKIIQFCSRNKLDLDMNLEFGLFLTNVNLKLGLKNKSRKLPKKLSLFLKSLLRENNKLIYYFQYMVYLNKDPHQKSNKMISSLFTNDTKWISRVRSYKRRPLENMQGGSYDSNSNNDKGLSIYAYIENIKNVDQMVPTPKLSDLCFRSLASNIDHQLRSSTKCILYEPCYYALKRGTDYGYGLSHRLLLVINARLARGCYVFTSDFDRTLAEKFCQMAYDEIQFVTTQGYEIIDLILEFITLCALDGHAQFLRQDWLAKSLRFQTSYGCFGVTTADDSKVGDTTTRPHSWRLAKKDHRLLGGLCDGHVTSVAAAALSAAIRYLLETYY